MMATQMTHHPAFWNAARWTAGDGLLLLHGDDDALRGFLGDPASQQIAEKILPGNSFAEGGEGDIVEAAIEGGILRRGSISCSLQRTRHSESPSHRTSLASRMPGTLFRDLAVSGGVGYNFPLVNLERGFALCRIS
jgi:hypothetical protein